MPGPVEIKAMILVKAAPVLTSELQESMCVAAMRLGSQPEWIRLHPVPFRDLADDTKFRKYQTDHGWSTRRQRIGSLGEQTMCDLVERNRSGSGPDTPSLAVVRTVERPELLITERDSEQLANWQQRADAIAAQPSLFDDPETDKPQFEIIPWRFRYSYRCVAPNCNGHKQTIVDWEAVALSRTDTGIRLPVEPSIKSRAPRPLLNGTWMAS